MDIIDFNKFKKEKQGIRPEDKRAHDLSCDLAMQIETAPLNIDYSIFIAVSTSLHMFQQRLEQLPKDQREPLTKKMIALCLTKLSKNSMEE